MFKIPTNLRTNPIALFFQGIIAKWYLFVSIASMTILYWVYNGLKDLGLINKASSIIVGSFMYTQAIAQNCTPLIIDAVKFGKCVMNPPSYEPFTNEQKEQFSRSSFNDFQDEQEYYDYIDQDPYIQMLKKNDLNNVVDDSNLNIHENKEKKDNNKK